MKNKWLFLVLLILFLFIFSACSAGDNTPDEDEIPLEEVEYVFDECVYLAGWTSITIETMTEMKKGELALDRTDTSMNYRRVSIYHNLDETSYDFIDEDKLNRNDIVIRFDVYNEGHFTGLTILIDEQEQAYIAYLGRFGNNTKYQFYEIWSITLNE